MSVLAFKRFPARNCSVHFINLQISDIMRDYDNTLKRVCLSRRLRRDFVWRHILVCRQMSPCRLMCKNHRQLAATQYDRRAKLVVIVGHQGPDSY